jgi:hypothetical protein
LTSKKILYYGEKTGARKFPRLFFRTEMRREGRWGRLTRGLARSKKCTPGLLALPQTRTNVAQLLPVTSKRSVTVVSTRAMPSRSRPAGLLGNLNESSHQVMRTGWGLNCPTTKEYSNSTISARPSSAIGKQPL